MERTLPSYWDWDTLRSVVFTHSIKDGSSRIRKEVLSLVTLRISKHFIRVLYRKGVSLR